MTAAVLRNKFQGKCSINAVTPVAAHVVSIDSASLQTNGSVTKPLAHLGTVFPRGQHIYVLVSCWSRGCVLPPPPAVRTLTATIPAPLLCCCCCCPPATPLWRATVRWICLCIAPRAATLSVLTRCSLPHLTTYQSGSNPCVPRS